MSKLLRTIPLLFICLLLPYLALAQMDSEYFAADQLLRQQNYEQAYQKFYKLHRENPNAYIYLEKATECLINLKKYDKALEITGRAAQNGNLRGQADIRLGEIHHISGATEKAFSIWEQVLSRYSASQQIQLRVARTLSERQLFDRSVEIYRQIRKQFPNSNIISSELAATFLQAGNYEEAIQEFLGLVKRNPERMSYVQQRLIRFQDDNVYDVAILEISDFLEELSPSHPSYRNLQQLEVWLLMERGLHQRALVTAKHYESQSDNITYLLYNLGSKLLASQKFELAEQAYSYYVDNDIYSIKYRSLEELSQVYRRWARYMENYNLGLSQKRDELYRKAYRALETIREQNPNYRRTDKVLVGLSELSLDILHKPDAASRHLSELQQMSDSTLIPETSYIEGRMHLYGQDYTRARIAFTRSNKHAETGSLAEKARYYLALTDFYSGDYEFAKIQLNALERQKTSYFANDAVQLRLWIQNGLQADSTGKQLDTFARAIEYFSQGKDQLGGNKLQDIIGANSYHPLLDDAILELSTHKNRQNISFIYRTLNNFLASGGTSSPLHERLLWEKARIADQLITNEDLNISLVSAAEDSLRTESPSAEIPTNREELVEVYEAILLNYPNGFYASYARDRIQELQNPQT